MVNDEEAFYEIRRKSGRQPRQPSTNDGLTDEQRRQIAEALAASKDAATKEEPWPGEE